MSALLEEQIEIRVKTLPDEQQRRVLEFAHSLSGIDVGLGTPGAELLDLAGVLPQDVGEQMMRDITEAREASIGENP